jgi:hypothetical protein
MVPYFRRIRSWAIDRNSELANRKFATPNTIAREGRQVDFISTHRGIGHRVVAKEDVTLESEAKFGRMEAVAAHPLAELLECPPATGALLNGASKCIEFDAGEVVFRQSEICKGLYVVVSGQFQRRAERLETTLALGDAHHTYTLRAQTPGMVLLLPIDVLRQAFESYPSMRMRLLEELAREVSRAYFACCRSREMQTRRRGMEAPPV